MTDEAPWTALPLRRVGIGAILFAAALGLTALAGGGLGETEGRTILTSLMLGLTMAAIGASLGAMTAGREIAIVATAVRWSSVTGFVLLTVALWSETHADIVWRIGAACGIIALEGAHACQLHGSARGSTTPVLRLAVAAGSAAATVSAAVGLAAVSGLADTHDHALVTTGIRLLAMFLIVQIATTALVPMLRRADHAPPSPGTVGDAAPATESPAARAAELLVIADRLEQAASPSAVRAECARLRDVARRTAAG